MKVALAQINPTVGDFDGNAAKIRENAAEARHRGADLEKRSAWRSPRDAHSSGFHYRETVLQSRPQLRHGPTTAFGLPRRARLWNFTKITPAERDRRAYTSSPKSWSSVTTTRLSLAARSIT